MYLCNFSIKSMFHGKNYQVLKINNWNCYKGQIKIAKATSLCIILYSQKWIPSLTSFYLITLRCFISIDLNLCCYATPKDDIFFLIEPCACVLLLIQWMFTLHRLNTNPCVTFVILLAFSCIFSILIVAFSYGIHNVINFRWRISIFCKWLFDSLLNNGYQLTISELNIKNFYLVLLNNVSL